MESIEIQHFICGNEKTLNSKKYLTPNIEKNAKRGLIERNAERNKISQLMRSAPIDRADRFLAISFEAVDNFKSVWKVVFI